MLSSMARFLFFHSLGLIHRSRIADFNGMCMLNFLRNYGDFPGGAVVKNPPANAGDTGWSPGLGRSHMPRSN